MTTTSPIIVALDYDNRSAAEAMADQLDPKLCRVKVGKELFTYCGPSVVKVLVDKGFDVFLDLKFHDIPNTVAGAVKAAADLGVWMVNVHASGGQRMMEAAANALSGLDGAPLLTAVTVLTSMTEDDLKGVGVAKDPLDQVKHLAQLAQQSGMDGVVCSAQEVSELRPLLGEDFLLVTPGIRPVDAALGDQRRVATPAAALEAGSTHLVIGRPITQNAEPLTALNAICQEVGLA